jgi:predicted dehydrogenase
LHRTEVQFWNFAFQDFIPAEVSSMDRKQLSRRDFMRGTAAATGAIFGARTVVLEPGPLEASPCPVPPSDRVSFGLVGVGIEGSGLLKTTLQIPGVECAAAADLYDGHLGLAKEIMGEQPVTTTRRYRELLENKDIDCIICATPDHWHKQVVIDCCNAGKDVYCEKPMSHGVSEGYEMVAAEQKTRRIVQVGSQRVSSTIFAKAKELVSGGAIGDIYLVEASMGRNGEFTALRWPPPPDLSPQTLDWETWLGPAPKIPFNPLHFSSWRMWYTYGSGIAGDLFVHLLSGIYFALGIQQPPQRALAVGGQYKWKDERDIPDIHCCLYEHPQLVINMRVTVNTDTGDNTKFLGTRGTIEIHGKELILATQDDKDHQPSHYIRTFPKSFREEFARKWHEENDAIVARNVSETTTYLGTADINDTKPHLVNFFDAVRARRRVVEDTTFGNIVSIACHMANYSYVHKGVAVWDASSKTIRG